MLAGHQAATGYQTFTALATGLPWQTFTGWNGQARPWQTFTGWNGQARPWQTFTGWRGQARCWLA